MKIFLPVLVLVVMLSGCASTNIREQFDESVELYNNSVGLLQWGNAGAFTASSISKEFKKRAEAAGDVQVIDCRIIDKTYNAKKRKAVVDVDIEYYKNFSPVVKILHDKQKWAYRGKNGTKRWKLVSLIPEFK